MSRPNRRDLLVGLAASAGRARACPVREHGGHGRLHRDGVRPLRLDPPQPLGLPHPRLAGPLPQPRHGRRPLRHQIPALHFWGEDGVSTRLYPTSVPVTDELTRLGRTEAVRKAESPTWRPTPSMRADNPDWPEVVPGGDPLGVRGMYLD